MKWTTHKIDSRQWPQGSKCRWCDNILKMGEVAVATRGRTIGTIAFHKECLYELVGLEMPTSSFEEIRERILQSGGLLAEQ